MSLSGYGKFAKRVLVKRGLPVQLIFFVTSRCNLRCAHCFYWRNLNAGKDELSLDEIEAVSKGFPDLLSVSLTGGEPFLRTDLAKIARAFCRNSNAKHLLLFTNGMQTERIYAVTEEILSTCKDAYVFVSVSFDGLRETHNRIRGNPEAFDRAKETFERLGSLKDRYDRLALHTVTTCSGENQHELRDLFEFMRKELRPDDMALTLIRGDTKDPKVKAIDIRYYDELCDLKRRDGTTRSKGFYNAFAGRVFSARESLGYRMVREAYVKQRFVTRCYAGTLTAILYENGEVFPCETLNLSMGNVREHNLEFRKLWFSEKAEQIRRRIERIRCFCTYECAMTPNILFNPRHYFRLAKEVVGC